MPTGFKFEEPDDEPLWEPGEVTVTIPTSGGPKKFDVAPSANTPMEDTAAGTMSFVRDTLVMQIEPEQQEEFGVLLTAALTSTPPLIPQDGPQAFIAWIGEQRAAYREKQVEAATKRPTGARSRSPRSSSK